MNALEKYTKFMELHKKVDAVAIVGFVGNQSLRTTLPCGCSMVSHPLVKTHVNPIVNADRKFFVEFCPIHEI